MAWQFTKWREFSGTGGFVAVVLVVAGAAMSLLPWFDREPAESYYFTTRDAAEIVGAVAEREIAMFNTTETNYAPLAQSGFSGYSGWGGHFASTNGAFTTNAIGRYAEFWNLFWSLDEDLPGMIVGTGDEYNSHLRRYWVDLWEEGGVQQAYEYKPKQPVGPNWGGADTPFLIDQAWWTNNIFAGPSTVPWADNLPMTNMWYVETNLLYAVGRALSACRWTVDDGLGSPYWQIGTNRLLDPSITWRGQSEKRKDKNWTELLIEAVNAIESAEGEVPNYPRPTPYTVNQHLAMLPYSSVVQHYALIYLYQYSDTNRLVQLVEHVSAAARATITVGTNCTVHSIGAPEPYDDELFYHPDYYEDPDCLILIPSGVGIPVRVHGGNADTVNAFAYFDKVLEWDGRFDFTAYNAFMPPGPPFEDDGSSSTNVCFGWQQDEDCSAFVIDWHFLHLTKRAAFWP